MLLELLIVNLLCHEFLNHLSEGVGGHLSLVAHTLLAHRYEVVALLLLTHDEQEGDTLELVVANLAANLLITQVNLTANIAII